MTHPEAPAPGQTWSSAEVAWSRVCFCESESEPESDMHDTHDTYEARVSAWQSCSRHPEGSLWQLWPRATMGLHESWHAEGKGPSCEVRSPAWRARSVLAAAPSATLLHEWRAERLGVSTVPRPVRTFW